MGAFVVRASDNLRSLIGSLSNVVFTSLPDSGTSFFAAGHCDQDANLLYRAVCARAESYLGMPA
jgi:hypothetical protein